MGNAFLIHLSDCSSLLSDDGMPLRCGYSTLRTQNEPDPAHFRENRQLGAVGQRAAVEPCAAGPNNVRHHYNIDNEC